MDEKEIQNIRKRKTYKEMAETLRWLETKEATPIEILRRIYPSWAVRKKMAMNDESLEQLVKDYNGTTNP